MQIGALTLKGHGQIRMYMQLKTQQTKVQVVALMLRVDLVDIRYMILHGKTIRMIAASNVTFGQYTTTDFYSNWVCLNGIDDLKELSVVTPEKTYTFGIVANTDEEAEDKYVITYNGTKLDCQSFQDYYQELISITCTDYTVDSVSGNADYSFVFKFKDEIGGENRINFIKASETRYQYSSDGEMLGKVNASALNKIIRELEKLVG